MSYVRQTIALHSVAPDLIAADAPADVWNDVRNVLFRNGESVRTPGDVLTLGTTRTPLVLVYFGLPGVGFWVYVAAEGVFAHDGTTETDITPAGWAAPAAGEVFTACVMGGVAYVNGSERDPVYWTGNTGIPCEVLPDWPGGGRCLALRAHKAFLFAVGMVSEGAQRVRWSDAAEAGAVPQFWAPAADNLAGFVDLAPLASACLDGLTLRDSFMVYKGESIWSLDFVGGNAVFAARKVFSEHGIASTHAVTGGVDDVHLFAGFEGDVWVHDGVTARSVLDGRAQRTVAGLLSREPEAVVRCVTLAREKLGFVMFGVSGETSASMAVVLDYVSGDIGFRELPDVLCAAEGARIEPVADNVTWDADAEAWDQDQSGWPATAPTKSLDDVLIGGAFGIAVLADPATDDFLTGPVEAILEKSGIALGDPSRRKTVGRLWPKVLGRAGDVLEFRLGAQETTGGAVTLGPPVMFTIGASDHLDTFLQGRYLSLQVSSSGGSPWRLGSIDVEFRPSGAF